MNEKKSPRLVKVEGGCCEAMDDERVVGLRQKVGDRNHVATVRGNTHGRRVHVIEVAATPQLNQGCSRVLCRRIISRFPSPL